MVMYSSTLFVACFFTKDLYKAHFEAKWPQHHRGTRGKKRPLWFEKKKQEKKGRWNTEEDAEDEWADWTDWYSGPTSERRDDDWKSWQDWGSGNGQGRWTWAWVC